MPAKVVGIYKVKSRTKVHLVELELKDLATPLDFMAITQEQKGRDRSDWQVPYKEYLLDATGNQILTDEWESIAPERLVGTFRVVFFFHLLERRALIKTQFGDLPLPKETKFPNRLANIVYTEPD